MKVYEANQAAADPTCGILCVCGWPNELWVSDNHIARRPQCGRGYTNQFITYQFEKDELCGQIVK